jgi:hypothetical protein
VATETKQVTYIAEATPREFHRSKDNLRMLFGPIGSGKSVACAVEVLSQAMQMPACKDGVRRSRVAVVRNTYPELVSTTIKTMLDWLPEEITTVKYNTPITINVKIPKMGDGTSMDLEILCLAIDRPADAKKLLSLEISGCWINEAREIDKSIVDAATGRIGRYPSKNMLGNQTYRKYIILDTNPPDDSSWIYKIFEEQPAPPGWSIYYQPPAIIYSKGEWKPNPEAENVTNHIFGFDYYMDQIAGKDIQWIKVYLQGMYGSSIAGKPVYETSWNDDLHISEVDLKPVPGRELILGWDFGLDPSVTMCQLTPLGQVQILDEFTAHGSGVKQFIETVVMPVLSTKYKGCPITSIGDPAGSQRAQTDEQTVFKEMERLGIPTEPCSTNNPQMRIEAVAFFLNQLSNGKPRFILSRHCKLLRKGFNGGYRYRQLNVSGETRYTDKPEKNSSSHIHDSLQYAMVYLKEDIIIDSGTEYAPHVAQYNTAGVAGY